VERKQGGESDFREIGEILEIVDGKLMKLMNNERLGI